MTQEVNITFFLGETWQRNFLCTDPITDTSLDLTGATAKWRLADETNSLIELTTSDGLTINGSYINLTCSTDKQAAAALVTGVYSHELRVYRASGAVVTALSGSFVVRNSLFNMAAPAGNTASPKPLGLLLLLTG